MSNDQNKQQENDNVQQQAPNEGGGNGNGGNDNLGHQDGGAGGTDAGAEGAAEGAATKQAEGEGSSGSGDSSEAGSKNAPPTLSEEERTEFAKDAVDEAARATTDIEGLTNKQVIEKVTAAAIGSIAALELGDAETAELQSLVPALVVAYLAKYEEPTPPVDIVSNAPNGDSKGTSDDSAPPVHIPLTQVGSDSADLAAAHDKINEELEQSVNANQEAPAVAPIVTGLSPISTIVLAELDKYIAAMAPTRRMDAVQGALHQAALFRTIKKALLHTEAEFDLVWQSILAKFVEHGGENDVFGDRNLFRFYESLTTLQGTELDQYRALVNLLKNTATVQANGAARKLVLKQTNFSATIKHLEPIAAERLQNFYQVQ